MGFRFGWFGKWGGGTWGPKGGWRFYGYAGGRKKKTTGCVIPFAIMVMSVVLLIVFVLGV